MRKCSEGWDSLLNVVKEWERIQKCSNVEKVQRTVLKYCGNMRHCGKCWESTMC